MGDWRDGWMKEKVIFSQNIALWYDYTYFTTKTHNFDHSISTKLSFTHIHKHTYTHYTYTKKYRQKHTQIHTCPREANGVTTHAKGIPEELTRSEVAGIWYEVVRINLCFCACAGEKSAWRVFFCAYLCISLKCMYGYNMRKIRNFFFIFEI